MQWTRECARKSPSIRFFLAARKDGLDERIGTDYEKVSRQGAGGSEKQHPQTTLDGIPIAQEKTISSLAGRRHSRRKTRLRPVCLGTCSRPGASSPSVFGGGAGGLRAAGDRAHLDPHSSHIHSGHQRLCQSRAQHRPGDLRGQSLCRSALVLLAGAGLRRRGGRPRGRRFIPQARRGPLKGLATPSTDAPWRSRGLRGPPPAILRARRGIDESGWRGRIPTAVKQRNLPG
jgi:hypothetical protein